MCEKDAGTRYWECCYWAISLIAKFWLIAKCFKTEFTNSEFSPVHTGFAPFFTQKSQFWFPNTPNSSPKFIYTFMYLKGKQNHIKLEIKTTFQHKSSIQPFFTKTLINNSTRFHQNFQQQLNSHHQSIIMNTQYTNSSTTHPITTTTTTINHEIIHNLTTTTSFYINFVQTQSIPLYTLQACKFNINNTIIIQFTYINMSSNSKNEFLQLSSK